MSDRFDENELVEELDYIISTVLGQTLDDYALKSEPKDGSLKGALNAYTKEKLLKLAGENGITVHRKWKKNKLIEVISEGLMHSLDDRFLILQRRTLVLLQYMADGKFDSDEYEMEQIEFLLTVFESAVRMGLLYVSEEVDGVKMSIPVPIKERIDDAVIMFEELIDTHENEFGLWDNMNDVLTAGVNLYGVMTVQKFYDLWETRHPLQDITLLTDYQNKIEKYLPLLIIRNGLYFIEGKVIANPTFGDEEEAIAFYQLRTYRMGYTYYEPSEEEILFFAENEFNRETLSYKKLQLEVAKMTEAFEMAMQMIETHMLLGDDVSELFVHMVDMGVLDFTLMDNQADFVKAYDTVNLNTRIWKNAGYTPQEMTKKRPGQFSMTDIHSKDDESVDSDDFDSGKIISLDDYR